MKGLGHFGRKKISRIPCFLKMHTYAAHLEQESKKEDWKGGKFFGVSCFLSDLRDLGRCKSDQHRG